MVLRELRDDNIKKNGNSYLNLRECSCFQRERIWPKRICDCRRAQEYEAKINSGDLIAIAEVVRDLFRNENQPEQSYSERQLYEAALERMAREVATVNKTTDDEAILLLEAVLAKTTGGARRKNDNNEAA